MNEGERKFFPENERKVITLEDVIDPTRQIPEAYKPLILAQEQRGVYLGQNIWEFVRDFKHGKFYESYPHARDYLRQRLAGDVLIDLGGGRGDPKLAHYFNVGTYINVDRDIDLESLDSTSEARPNPLAALRETDDHGLHIIEVKADMLDFVARMRDESANFMLNAIDISVIDDRRYHEALAQELVRATKIGGVVFGVNATVAGIWRRMEKETPLRDQRLDFPGYGEFTFEKPE